MTTVNPRPGYVWCSKHKHWVRCGDWHRDFTADVAASRNLR